MTISIFILLIGVNLFLAYKKQYSKIITILTLIAILLFMAGAGPDYATENRSMDYLNYERRYNNIENVGITYEIQIGYTIIQRVGAWFGLEFFWFRLIVVAVCLMLLYSLVIRKYTNNANYVLAFYLLYPMIIDSEQLRNFIAMTIVLCSIPLLMKKSMLYKILFLVMILFAASVHSAFVLYLPLVFITNYKSSRFAKWVAGFSLVMMIAMLSNNNRVPFSNVIIEIFDERRITRYLSSSTNLGFVMPLVLTISSIVLVYWAKSISDREKDIVLFRGNKDILINYERIIIENRFINLVFWINLLSSFFFPFFMITIQFYRLPRNILILNIICYSLALNKLNKDSIHRIAYLTITSSSMILWLFIDLVITTSADRVLIPFFTNNYFFN